MSRLIGLMMVVIMVGLGGGCDCGGSGECSGDVACAEGWKCDTAKQLCGKECKSDADCKSDTYVGRLCLDGACVPKCAVDTDCPSGMKCDSGKCKDTGTTQPACKKADECKDGEICKDGKCSAGPSSCSTATDCGKAKTCKGGACVWMCNSDSVCATLTGNDKMRCESSVCVVAQCTKDSHCTNGKCKNYVCVECTVHTDCSPEGMLCSQNKCTKCTVHSMCSTGYCELTTGLCKVKPEGWCQVNTDCGAGMKCEGNKCVADAECSSTKPCPSGLKCVSGECVAETCQDVCDGGKCDEEVCYPEISKNTDTYILGKIEGSVRYIKGVGNFSGFSHFRCEGENSDAEYLALGSGWQKLSADRDQCWVVKYSSGTVSSWMEDETLKGIATGGKAHLCNGWRATAQLWVCIR